MSEAKRALPVILIHFVLGLIGCLVFSFFKSVPVGLIEPFITGYRLRAGLLLFIMYMPALQISGLLLGYALAFSKNSSENIDRWSAQLLSYLQGAFILCLLCISVYVILAEGISPFLEARQSESIARTDDYNDYLSVARESHKKGELFNAEFQASSAVLIWPKSRIATELLEKIQYEIAATGESSLSASELQSGVDIETTLRNVKGLTVLDALMESKKAEKANDFYNAHYYAMMAYRLAPNLDPNKAEAMRLASNAWNQISGGTDSLRAEDDMQLYAKKRSGYNAIQNGDYLNAYYIFLSLYDQELSSQDGRKDPDVERFLEVARKGVLDSFFFIDETLNMRLFESARDVFFVIKHTDGSSDSVFIRGITYTQESGTDMAYLRDFEFARFDAAGTLVYQITVPYVKMFPYTAAGKTKPELMFTAVNRNRAGSDIVPTVVSGIVPESEKNILVLDMPYVDLDLIITANKGPATMSLIDLFKFVDRAEVYGFSRTIYLSELINRLADPFLMLIISIYALILGWKYRLGTNVLFKAWWILVVPLFPFLSMYLIETIRYLSRLCIVFFVGLAPQNPILLILVFLSFWFAGISIYFFSQRSD